MRQALRLHNCLRTDQNCYTLFATFLDASFHEYVQDAELRLFSCLACYTSLRKLYRNVIKGGRHCGLSNAILCTQCAGGQTASTAPGQGSLFDVPQSLSPSATLLQPFVNHCKSKETTRLSAGSGSTSIQSSTGCGQDTEAQLMEAMYLSSRASQIAYNRKGEFTCPDSNTSIMLPFGQGHLSPDHRQRTLTLFKAESDGPKQHQYTMHQCSTPDGTCRSIIAACGGTRQLRDWGCNLHMTPDDFANPASFKVCMSSSCYHVHTSIWADQLAACRNLTSCAQLN